MSNNACYTSWPRAYLEWLRQAPSTYWRGFTGSVVLVAIEIGWILGLRR